MSIGNRFLLFAASPALFALVSIAMGKKTGWDLFNYHWYNPFAWLNNRFGFDVAVGHHATYYNPLTDLPLYLIASHGPAWLGGVFMGAMAGLTVSLIGAIAYCVLPITKHRVWVAAALALLGGCGAGAFQEIGDPANDIPAAIGSFIALLILVANISALQNYKVDFRIARILLAVGLCAGAAVGLKLTTAVYGFGVGVAVLIIAGPIKVRALRLAVFGGGAIVGVLLCGGFWMLRMWEFSGNPFFPYFNDVFHSPLLVTTGYLDPNFRPENWTERLLFPFFFTADSHYVSESGFRDAHILAIYVLIPITLLLSIVGRARPRVPDSPQWMPRVHLLFAFAGGSYLAWLVVFDVYRYLIPLEMLSPLLIALAFATWPIPVRVRAVATVATLIALQLVVRIDISDRQSWTGPFVQVAAPALREPANSLILMTGHEAMAFVIPFFPHEVPFLRIDGWLVQGSDATTGLAKQMRGRVTAHRGPLFVLYSDKEQQAMLTALQNYSLEIASDRLCSRVESNITDALLLCPVTSAASKLPVSAQGAQPLHIAD